MSSLICKNPFQGIKPITTRIMNSHRSPHYLNSAAIHWCAVNGELTDARLQAGVPYPYKLQNEALLHENLCINLQAGKVTTFPKLLLCFISGNDEGKASLVTQQSQTDRPRIQGRWNPSCIHCSAAELHYHQRRPALTRCISLLLRQKTAAITVRQFLCASIAAKLGFRLVFLPKRFFWFTTRHPVPMGVDKKAYMAHITNEGMTLAESMGWSQLTQSAAPPSLCSALSSAGCCGARRLQGPALATRSTVEMLGTHNFRNFTWCPSIRHVLRAAWACLKIQSLLRSP